MVRPMLPADRGDVELIGVSEGVSVRLKGACGGCPMATMTLKERNRKNTQRADIRGQGSSRCSIGDFYLVARFWNWVAKCENTGDTIIKVAT